MARSCNLYDPSVSGDDSYDPRQDKWHEFSYFWYAVGAVALAETAHTDTAPASAVEAKPVCAACKQAFDSRTGHSVCTECLKKQAEMRLAGLISRRFDLSSELRTLEAEIQLLTEAIQAGTAHQAVPDAPPSVTRCAKCRGSLTFGYRALPGSGYMCKLCGIREGDKDIFKYQRARFCDHGYPMDMCQPCTAVQRVRVKEARDEYAKNNPQARSQTRTESRSSDSPSVAKVRAPRVEDPSIETIEF